MAQGVLWPVPYHGTAHSWQCQALWWHHGLMCPVPCATLCGVPPPVPHSVPCHGPHPTVCHAMCHTMLSHLPHHVPHYPMSHPMCSGKDIRHNLAARIQPLPAHSHQDRHRDKGTQGHDISVVHGPRSALYFLLPLYKNKEVPRGRGHCPPMCTKNINIHK